MTILSAIGCPSDPPESEGAGGQAGHGSTTTSSAGGHGGGSDGGGSDGGGSDGGGSDDGGGGGTAAAADFALLVVPATVDIPYGGLTSVPLTIRRINGFDAPIDVIVNAPPEGLVVSPLVIPPDATSGALEVGASGELTEGTTFNLELVGRSDDLLRFAAVAATVVSTAP
ncbi:hypothetical protein WME76_47310 (plasmid) [Sorangium sp. So ce119]|uniref:hypothetical protein n=1 Tax=Sorangium sp. So ce119 TaxID=3133279 RepID=UPI003F612AFD